jgi:hypothetical protein
MAGSILDPENINMTSRHTLLSGDIKSIKTHPHALAAPTPFPRLISASPSGNVNSDTVLCFFRDFCVPWLRSSGYTRQHLIRMLLDRHSSHESEELIVFLKTENIILMYYVSHGTALLQARPGSISNVKKVQQTLHRPMHVFFG